MYKEVQKNLFCYFPLIRKYKEIPSMVLFNTLKVLKSPFKVLKDILKRLIRS